MTATEAVVTEGLPHSGGSAGRQTPRSGSATRRWRKWGPILVFLAPATFVYSVFMVYPLLDSLRRSFFDDDGNFAGLDNYDTLFLNPTFADRFWDALGHNFQFFAFHMVLQNPIGLLLAVLLTVQSVRGLNIYRTIVFLPTTLSVVIVGFIWRLILSPIWGVTDTVRHKYAVVGRITHCVTDTVTDIGMAVGGDSHDLLLRRAHRDPEGSH